MMLVTERRRLWAAAELGLSISHSFPVSGMRMSTFNSLPFPPDKKEIIVLHYFEMACWGEPDGGDHLCYLCSVLVNVSTVS